MSPTVLKFLSSLFYSASGAFQNFWRSRENLCMNRVRSLLSMRYLLQGYISEPRPNSRDLRTKGSVKRFAGLSIYRYLVSATWKARRISSLLLFSSLKNKKGGCAHSLRFFTPRRIDKKFKFLFLSNEEYITMWKNCWRGSIRMDTQ